MPKSKRDKKVSLTKTQKKGMPLKQALVNEIRECVDKYARLFTFSVHNMRNSKLKDVRQQWKHSRFFFGKNKVMGFALGRGSEDEYKDNLHRISKKLKGQTGLLFTNQTKDEVVRWFESFSEIDYARSGNIASQTVVVRQGPLKEFSHAMEPQLRQLGLPTSLQRGVITLNKDHKVCTKGDVLTPEQCRILKLFCHPMAEFRFALGSMWSRSGKIEAINQQVSSSLPSSVTVQAPEKSAVTEDADMYSEEGSDVGDDDDEQHQDDAGSS